MRLVFIHGWSVTHTGTYRDMPKSLQKAGREAGLDIDVQHIYLGRYISFHDAVTLSDIVRAFHHALHELPGNEKSIQPFSCITHSTGGPIVRSWVAQHYADRQSENPLQHLVMLAPANHGSALAALGKARVGRVKAWFANAEPGQRVLDWLCLGSDGQYQLNHRSMSLRYGAETFFPFVIAGQGIDTQMYDFLNAYLAENGSDGVVRVCSANINCRSIQLRQTLDKIPSATSHCYRLELKNDDVQFSQPAPLAVLHDASHTGEVMGVMNAKRKQDVHAKTVSKIIEALSVKTDEQYQQLFKDWWLFSDEEQLKIPVGKRHAIGRYGMLVIRVFDHEGYVLQQGDFDVLLLASKDYSPNELPCGFFVDRQFNRQTHALVYYLHMERMLDVKDRKFGLRVIARPSDGFAYYQTAEFQAGPEMLAKIFAANETTYIDIQMQRFVDETVFQFDSARGRYKNFKRILPSGRNVLDDDFS